MSDMLKEQWTQQVEFMKLLQEKRNFPEFPLDLKSKSGQKFLKDITNDCIHELFESNHLLKNSKQHRATNVSEFDRENYVEELVDSLHFFYEICILSGISLEELHEAYIKKGKINMERINSGY